MLENALNFLGIVLEMQNALTLLEAILVNVNLDLLGMEKHAQVYYCIMIISKLLNNVHSWFYFSYQSFGKKVCHQAIFPHKILLFYTVDYFTKADVVQF